MDDVLKSIGKDSSKEGHNVSPIIDMKLTRESDIRWYIKWVWNDMRMKYGNTVEWLVWSETYLQYCEAWQMTWKHLIDEYQEHTMMIIRELFDWYESNISRLPNFNTRRKHVPCSTVIKNSFHNVFQKTDPLPSNFPPPWMASTYFFLNEIEEDNICSV